MKKNANNTSQGFSRHKLLLIGNNLINGQGGVEHVLCNMANVMDNYGYNATIATMESKQGSTFYNLNKNVQFYNLYEEFSFFEKVLIKLPIRFSKFFVNLRHRNKIFNKFIQDSNPDLIICFSLPILLDVTHKKDFDIPIILTVHGNPINDYTNRFWPRPNYENKLLKNSYQKADVIQVLLDSYQSTVPKSFKGKIVTISNIAKKFDDFTIRYQKQGQKKIVIIASLDERKHQDLLIRAFSSIANDYPDWIIELWGSGYKKKEYQKMISNFGMKNRIFLKGSTKNVEQVLKDTDIFALPSTCEGWPLVLGEAMNMGIPCIGLSICDGVNKIIRHNQNGVLSENSQEDFAEKLKFLMDNPDKRKELGLQAQKDMTKYSEDIIWGKWIDLIQKSIKGNPMKEPTQTIDKTKFIKETEPAISVIIPVYNSEKYLKETLDSILNQTFSNIEIICIDDGSSDNSLNILKKYQKQDNRIKVLTQQNQGVVTARNNAISKAKGEFIYLLDSDDIVDKTILEKSYNAIIADKGDIICSRVLLFGLENKEAICLTPTKENMSIGNCMTSTSSLFRKSLFYKTGGFDRAFDRGIEDYDFYLNMTYRQNARFYRIPEILLFYRIKSPDESRNKQVTREIEKELINALYKKYPEMRIYKFQKKCKDFLNLKKVVQAIFSIKNEGIYKVIRILGIKIKFRRNR